MQQTGWIYIVVVEPKRPHCTMLKDEAAAQPRYTKGVASLSFAYLTEPMQIII